MFSHVRFAGYQMSLCRFLAENFSWRSHAWDNVRLIPWWLGRSLMFGVSQDLAECSVYQVMNLLWIIVDHLCPSAYQHNIPMRFHENAIYRVRFPQSCDLELTSLNTWHWLFSVCERLGFARTQKRQSHPIQRFPVRTGIGFPRTRHPPEAVFPVRPGRLWWVLHTGQKIVFLHVHPFFTNSMLYGIV